MARVDPIGRYLRQNPRDSQSQLALRNGIAPSVICDVRKGRKNGFPLAVCERIANDLAGKPGAPTKDELLAYWKRPSRQQPTRPFSS